MQIAPAPANPPANPIASASPTAALPATLTAAAPSPAAQVAPALVALTHAPDGAPRLTLRLDPPELGLVQIRIERPQDAPARVEITVQRQETLTLLLRDQPQLQTALNQAGVPLDGRSITFHLVAPEPVARSDGSAPNSGTDFAGQSGNGADGASRQGGSAQQRSADGMDDNNDANFTPIAVPTWLRAGLDITA
jgi:flagellar hook-length control protein FliK